MVDATSKYELLSFMNAFLGYHQIKMHPSNVKKISFITERGLTVLLQSHAFGIKKCRGDVPEIGEQYVQGNDWEDYRD